MNIKKLLNNSNKKKLVLTENGALAYKSSGDKCGNLFFNIGTFRNKSDKDDFFKLFKKAVAEDEKLSLNILLWSRDCRGGAGVREPLRFFMELFLKQDEDLITENMIFKIVELGYWKDVFNLYKIKNISVKQKEELLEIICNIFLEKTEEDFYPLFTKYFPRKGKLFFDVAEKTSTPHSTLRKHIVKYTKVVETKMCSRKWSEIDYSSVPSIASCRYSHSFIKHDSERYNQYIQDVKNGIKKINTSVITPTDLALKIIKTEKDDETVNLQWKNLDTSYFDNNEIRLLPISDVSGSMFCNNDIPISASLGLGLFIAQNNKGPLKNKLMNFSTNPRFFDVKDKTLYQTFKMMKEDWSMSTDICKVYDLLLNMSIFDKSTLPTHIIIFSDMQFDEAVEENTPFNLYKDKFKVHGLTMPKIIFWNLRSNVTFPARIDDNVLLVSGYSAQIAKEILQKADFDAMSFIRSVVEKEKYMF